MLTQQEEPRSCSPQSQPLPNNTKPEPTLHLFHRLNPTHLQDSSRTLSTRLYRYLFWTSPSTIEIFGTRGMEIVSAPKLRINPSSTPSSSFSNKRLIYRARFLPNDGTYEHLSIPFSSDLICRCYLPIYDKRPKIHKGDQSFVLRTIQATKDEKELEFKYSRRLSSNLFVSPSHLIIEF
jgi:hypothetical protein